MTSPAIGSTQAVATLQPDTHFSRILAVYGGISVAGGPGRGVVADGFQPERYDQAWAGEDCC